MSCLDPYHHRTNTIYTTPITLHNWVDPQTYFIRDLQQIQISVPGEWSHCGQCWPQWSGWGPCEGGTGPGCWTSPSPWGRGEWPAWTGRCRGRGPRLSCRHHGEGLSPGMSRIGRPRWYWTDWSAPDKQKWINKRENLLFCFWLFSTARPSASWKEKQLYKFNSCVSWRKSSCYSISYLDNIARVNKGLVFQNEVFIIAGVKRLERFRFPANLLKTHKSAGVPLSHSQQTWENFATYFQSLMWCDGL